MVGRRRGRHEADEVRATAPESPLLVICDLHVDALDGGPLGAPGALRVAERLAGAFATARATAGGGGLGYGGAVLAVEGGWWGTPSVKAGGCGLPPHCSTGDPFDGVAVAAPSPSELFSWRACPACGGDPLDLVADGRGQAFPLTAVLEPPGGGGEREVHVAGLAAEHGALRLACALVERRGWAGRVVFLHGASSFVDPASSAGAVARAVAAGVRVDTDRLAADPPTV